MSVRFVLGVHNHQPVGNFDNVFAEACDQAYAPFLALMAEFPRLPFVLHLSGSLLEWLEVHRKSYLKQLKKVVAAGQCEIIGGAFYEPILTMLPRRDRLGQIRRYGEHLGKLFGVRPRGLWLAERVWEPGLVSDLAEAGVEYTLLDDYHFRQAGLSPQELTQPFLTEDEGRTLTIFPISEPLRYLVPWKSPKEAVAYLRELGQSQPGAVAVCADDGEKFGAWPGTHKLCFTDGWLRDFVKLLAEAQQSGAVQVATLAAIAAEQHALPLAYLPDASYREMTEWSLPTNRQLELKAVERDLSVLPTPAATAVRGFLRGGLWRNFRAKYPEAREMYARMLEVSQRVEEARQTRHSRVTDAEQELYRAQCNCSYWHGAFGGLYLPHLRHAVYQHLLAAESLLGGPEGVTLAEADFNLDGATEVKLANEHLAAYVAPRHGGRVYELDALGVGVNLQASLARRPEPYHEAIRQAAAGTKAKSQVSLVEPEAVQKQEGLEKLLTYDRWPRQSLLEHFWPASVTLEAVRSGTAEELGEPPTQAWQYEATTAPKLAKLTLHRSGQVAQRPIKLRKTFSLAAHASRLEMEYQLDGLAGLPPLRLGIEFMVASMAAGQDDRYFVLEDGTRGGRLESVLELAATRKLTLVDEWRRLKVTLSWSRPAMVWAWPQQTVSQSEGGFEAVHQGNLVVPTWLLEPDRQGRFDLRLEYSVATLD